MGMDGLSMSNTGLMKEATSRDYSKESEETAKQETEKSMFVQELTEQERVHEESEENKKRRKAGKGKDGESSEEDEETDDNEKEDPNEKEEDNIDPENLLLIDGENKGFYTKLSKNLENIELYDRITDRLIGTITPDELTYLITKLNMGTGIFINKKV